MAITITAAEAAAEPDLMQEVVTHHDTVLLRPGVYRVTEPIRLPLGTTLRPIAS